MEILLVEDNLGDARLTFESLSEGRVKHRLTWLWDGAEASDFLNHSGKYAQAPRPDLILLDLDLPKKDGRELLAEIRASDEFKGIPVVVLTSSRAHDDFVRGELLQIESYITKPVDLDKFLDVVRELKRFWHADMIMPAAG